MSRRIASTERIGNLRVLEPRTTEIIRFGAVPGQRTNLGSCKRPDAVGLLSGVFNNVEALARGIHATSVAVEEAPRFGLQPIVHAG